MKRKLLFPNMIRVNKTKNLLNQRPSNIYPRYGSNVKNEAYYNYFYNDKQNFINYNNSTNKIEYATLTIDNYNRKKIKHIKTKDNLNDQLNLIKFKMSCDLIGQKINQLKTFVDCMNVPEEEKKLNIYNLKNNIISLNYLNNSINNNNNLNTNINKSHTIYNFPLKKNSDNFCFNSYDNKSKIKKYLTRPILNTKFINKNKNNINDGNNDINYLYQADNYFSEDQLKYKIFNKTCNNNFKYGENKKNKKFNYNNPYNGGENNLYDLYLNNNNSDINCRNKNLKNISPFDDYFVSKEEETNKPIYLTKNKNYQINSVMNNINLNINQNGNQNRIQNSKNIVNDNDNDINNYSIKAKSEFENKISQYKIENINTIFYNKTKRIGVHKVKKKSRGKINKFKDNLVEEKTVFSIINTEFTSPTKHIIRNNDNNELNDKKYVCLSEENIFKTNKIINEQNANNKTINEKNPEIKDKIENNKTEEINNKEIANVNSNNEKKNEIQENVNENKKNNEEKNIEEKIEKNAQEKIEKNEIKSKKENNNTFQAISKMFENSFEDSKGKDDSYRNNSLNMNKSLSDDEDDGKEDEEKGEESEEKELDEENEEKEDDDKEDEENEKEESESQKENDSNQENDNEIEIERLSLQKEDEIFSLIEQKTKEINKATKELNELKEKQEKKLEKEDPKKNQKEEKEQKEKKEKKENKETEDDKLDIKQNANNENKEKLEKEGESEIFNKIRKKKVNFDEQDNIIIEFNETENPKKIKIYNYREKEISFKPMDLKKYLYKLKKNQKLKPIILNYSKEKILQEKLDQKFALDKLSELIDECDEKTESIELNAKDKLKINSKREMKRSRNQKDNFKEIKNLKIMNDKMNKKIKDNNKDKKIKKFKRKIKYNNYLTNNDIQFKKEKTKENLDKKKLFSEKIKINNLNKIKNNTKKAPTLSNKSKNEKNNSLIHTKNKTKEKDNNNLDKAINNLKKYFEKDYKENN